MKNDMENNLSSNEESIDIQNENITENEMQLNNQEPINQDNKPNVFAKFKNKRTLMMIIITIMVLGLTTTSALYYNKSKNNNTNPNDNINDDPKDDPKDNPNDNDNNNDDDDIGDDDPIKSEKVLYIFSADGKCDYVSVSLENTHYVLLKAGEYKCRSLDCKDITEYRQYIAVEEENNHIYIYNCETKKTEYSPIININFAGIVGYDKKIYGLLTHEYNDDGYDVFGFYSFEKNKITIGAKYHYLDVEEHDISLKNNIIVARKGDYIYLLDILTGKEILKFEDRYIVLVFNERDKNTPVYYSVHDRETYKGRVYDKNGKLLFNGESFKDIRLIDKNNFLTTKDHEVFEVRDINNNISVTSKKYKEIFTMGIDYIFVLDNDNIAKFVNSKDELIANFTEWSNDHYFDFLYSGSNDEEIFFSYWFDSDGDELDECYVYIYNKKTGTVRKEEPGLLCPDKYFILEI
jgi:hypothetical protein